MSGTKNFFKEAGIIASATLGAGIFALPYVFSGSGIVSGIFYLLGLSAIVIVAHALYFRAVAASGGQKGLLELAKTYLGKTGYYVGLVAIVGGLTLTLTVYLLLGPSFINLLLPSLGFLPSLILFWFISTAPIFFKEKRILRAEILGTVFVAAIVFFIFFSAGSAAPSGEVVRFKNLFLPFGAVLFALAGWTGVEPLFVIRHGERHDNSAPIFSLAAGTFFVALLYLVFVKGILNSAGVVAADTVSGLANWPTYKIMLLGALGVFSLWVSYMPISLEIKNTLLREGVGRRASLAIVSLLPLILSLDGFRNFIEVIGLAGGVFLSLQYILIILVGEKSFPSAGLRKLFLNLILAVFALAIVYEIYYFVIK